MRFFPKRAARRHELIAAVATAGVLLAVTCGCESSPRAPQQPPRIVFQDTTYDFGRVEQGQQVAHTYAFLNAGDVDLNIDNVRAACECTATAIAARIVRPGGEGTIRATFDTAGSFGHTTRTISVYSNDPAQPVTTLTLTGTVDADIAANPPRLFVGRVERGHAAPNDVRFLGNRQDINFGPIDTSGRAIEAVIDTVTPRRLRIIVKKDAPLGPFKEMVTVHTSSRQQPLVRVPVTGVIEGAVAVSPTELSFGVVAAGVTASMPLAVRNRDQRPVHVTGVTLSPPVGRTQVTTVDDGTEYRVTVTLTDALPARRFEGTLEVHTDHPEQPVLAVPFSGRVVEKK